MFTGIVETTATVRSFQTSNSGARLVVDGANLSHRPATGDSIAVNGVCLTHAPDADRGTGQLAFDVVRETLDRSNLGGLRPGQTVNLEASVRPETPLAGHFVQGHVDAMGRIAEVKNTPEEWRTTIAVDPDLLPCIVPKGSIAIDGVSLTIAGVDLDAARFDVALIPTTLRLTNLGDRRPGDRVNLETDIIARTVVHYLKLQQQPPGLTADHLRAAGFDG